MKPRSSSPVSPLMRRLSAYAAGAARTPLPAPVAEKTKHHLLDTIAAMVSGSRLRPGKMAISFTKTLGGEKEAAVVGSAIVTSAANAALANGMLAHADETDDSHAASQTHPGCGIVAAALAMAERERARGTAMLRAIALGYDIGARLTQSLGAMPFRAAGHSTHSFGPGFGAAAAAGALARLDERRMRYVFSYAAQQASGVSCWMRDEEHIEKAFDFGGMPARNGVAAAAMVAHGFSGVEDVFSGERNFFVAFGPAQDPAELTRELGARYEIMNADIKRWTVGSPIQAPLRSPRGAGVASGSEHDRRSEHARYLHAALVRRDARGRHGQLQILPRRQAHARPAHRRAAPTHRTAGGRRSHARHAPQGRDRGNQTEGRAGIQAPYARGAGHPREPDEPRRGGGEEHGPDGAGDRGGPRPQILRCRLEYREDPGR